MARRRKQVYDPNQLSLFDFMANNVEQLREENIQADLAEAQQENTAQPSREAAPPENPVSDPVQQPFPFPTNDTSTMRLLGRNKQGASVYSMGDGSLLPS